MKRLCASAAAVLAILCSGCAGPRARGAKVAVPPGGGVTFVHVTDLHVTNESSEKSVAEALAGIGGMVPRPDFVFSTGDNVNKGDRAEEVSRYLNAVSGRVERSKFKL